MAIPPTPPDFDAVSVFGPAASTEVRGVAVWRAPGLLDARVEAVALGATEVAVDACVDGRVLVCARAVDVAVDVAFGCDFPDPTTIVPVIVEGWTTQRNANVPE